MPPKHGTRSVPTTLRCRLDRINGDGLAFVLRIARFGRPSDNNPGEPKSQKGDACRFPVWTRRAESRRRSTPPIE